MWDKVSDYLLSSKHDPLTIGTGEVGFEDKNNDKPPNRSGSSSDLSTLSPLKKKRSTKRKIGRNDADGFDDLSTMMSSVVSTCKELTNPTPATATGN